MYFGMDIILVKGLSKHTLNTYFSGMKINPKYAFFLICPSRPFQNLSLWPKTHPFSNFARFCTPKRCTRVHCLVLKNNPNYVIFFTRTISNFKCKCPPPGLLHLVDQWFVASKWEPYTRCANNHILTCTLWRERIRSPIILFYVTKIITSTSFGF